jgi:hypothetical protein
LRPEFTDLFFSCYVGLDGRCKDGDAYCFGVAVGEAESIARSVDDGVDSDYWSACQERAEECASASTRFNDEYCDISSAYSSTKVRMAELCLERPCGEIVACLEITMPFSLFFPRGR